jgi:hypothetical protein
MLFKKIYVRELCFASKFYSAKGTGAEIISNVGTVN